VKLWRLYARVSLGGVLLAVVLMLVELRFGDAATAGGWFYFVFYWIVLSAVVGLILLAAVGARRTVKRFFSRTSEPS
jgi:hypothetical protein